LELCQERSPIATQQKVALPRHEGSITMVGDRYPDSGKKESQNRPKVDLTHQLYEQQNPNWSNPSPDSRDGNGSDKGQRRREQGDDVEWVQLSQSLGKIESQIKELDNHMMPYELNLAFHAQDDKIIRLLGKQPKAKKFEQQINQIEKDTRDLHTKQEQQKTADEKQVYNQINSYKKNKDKIDNNIRELCDDEVKFVKAKMEEQCTKCEMRTDTLYEEMRTVQKRIEDFRNKSNDSKLTQSIWHIYEKYVCYLRNKNTFYEQIATIDGQILKIKDNQKEIKKMEESAQHDIQKVLKQRKNIEEQRKNIEKERDQLEICNISYPKSKQDMSSDLEKFRGQAKLLHTQLKRNKGNKEEWTKTLEDIQLLNQELGRFEVKMKEEYQYYTQRKNILLNQIRELNKSIERINSELYRKTINGQEQDIVHLEYKIRKIQNPPMTAHGSLKI
jgi:chromosome segregation ATPase